MGQSIADTPEERRLAALLTLGERQLAVAVHHLAPEGCMAEHVADCGEEAEFVSLQIEGGIAINGRVLRCQDGEAQIHFYGQLNPLAIDKVCRNS